MRPSHSPIRLSAASLQLLVEHRIYLNLLHSMLPKRVVEKVQSNLHSSFAESFRHVCILFSDIVSCA